VNFPSISGKVHTRNFKKKCGSYCAGVAVVVAFWEVVFTEVLAAFFLQVQSLAPFLHVQTLASGLQEQITSAAFTAFGSWIFLVQVLADWAITTDMAATMANVRIVFNSILLLI